MKTNCTRREFCQCMGKSALAVAIASTITNAGPLLGKSAAAQMVVDLDITTPQYAALAAIGGSLKIPDPNDSSRPAILCRTGATTVSAISSKCTHQGCEVGLPQAGKITCPCHGSQFDESGAVLKSPAAAPLKKYSASISGNTISVDFGGSKVTMESPIKSSESLNITKRGTSVEIAFRSNGRDPLQLRITDIHGRQIHSRSYESSPVIWDTRGLADGEYSVTINSVDKSLRSNFMVVLP